jgi:hypothetical protein
LNGQHFAIADETQMIVTWLTFDLTKTSTVWYGIDKLDNVTHGTVHKFIDGGDEKRHMFIHRVTLKGLKPGQTYSKLFLPQELRNIKLKKKNFP